VGFQIENPHQPTSFRRVSAVANFHEDNAPIDSDEGENDVESEEKLILSDCFLFCKYLFINCLLSEMTGLFAVDRSRTDDRDDLFDSNRDVRHG
jgi:hypothetical protein